MLFVYVCILDHHITVDVLNILTPKHVEILFCGLPVGDMTIFENELIIWRSYDNDMNYKTPDILRPTTVCDDVQSFVKSPICSVKDMLTDTQNGRLILKYYSEHNILHEQQRNLLINTIAKYIELKGYVCTLSDCSEIENQICTLFPTESKVRTIF